MKLYVLDFESFWCSKTYSLSLMGVEAYVRDPRFEVLLLAVTENDSPIRVFEQEKIAEVLKRLPLGDPDVLTVCQNISFDGFILKDHYGIDVANPVCARSLARLTGVARLTGESLAAQNAFHDYGQKKMGTVVSDGKHREDFTPEEWAFFRQYNAGDVDQTRHHTVTMLEKLSEWVTAGQFTELLAFDSLTENLYLNPRLVLDTGLLAGYEIELVERQEKAMQDLQRLFTFPDRENFITAIRAKGRTSPKLTKGLPTFPVMLEMMGIETPMKVSDKRMDSVTTSKTWVADTVRRLKSGGPASKEDVRLYNKHRKNIATGVMIPALAKTDPELMAMQEHENPDVALLCRTRAELNSSIELSRCRSLLGIARRGTLPVSLSAYQAITGRFAADNSAADVKSDSTNLQNLPSRQGNHTLKRSIRAPEGMVLVGADSSQIECRLNAFIWGQYDLVRAFAGGRDVYCEYASSLYNRPVTRTDKTERSIAKTCVLQLGYGSGSNKLATKLKQERLDIGTDQVTHEEESERLVKFYRHTYSRIKAGWARCKNVIKAMDSGLSGAFGGPDDTLFVYNGADDIFGRPAASVLLPDGYKIWMPALRWVQQGETVSRGIVADAGGYWFDLYNRRIKAVTPNRLYGSKLCALVCQGLAFAIIRWQMMEINKAYPVVTNCHDSIITLAPEGEGEKVLDFMLRTMETAPPWLPDGLPLAAEGAFGRTYADT